MTAITNMMKQIEDGNYTYVAKRLINKIFPVPNPIFYWDSFVMMKGMFKEKEVKSKKFTVEIIGPREQKGNMYFNELLDQFREHDYNHQRMGKGTCIIVKAENGMIASYAWMNFKKNSNFKDYSGNSEKMLFLSMNRVYLPTGSHFTSNSGYRVYFDEPVNAWGYGFYVRPKYRLSSAFMLLTQAMRNLCMEVGCDMIYGETNMENQASQKSFGNLGKKVYEKVYFVSLFKAKVYITKSDDKRLRFQFRWTNDTHQISYIPNV